MTPPKVLRLVRVIWEDASIVDEGTWAAREDAVVPEVVVFDQVGWLMELTTDHVVITACVGAKLMAPRDRIPAGMIRSITEYAVPSGTAVPVPKKRKKKAA